MFHHNDEPKMSKAQILKQLGICHVATRGRIIHPITKEELAPSINFKQNKKFVAVKKLVQMPKDFENVENLERLHRKLAWCNKQILTNQLKLEFWETALPEN